MPWIYVTIKCFKKKEQDLKFKSTCLASTTLYADQTSVIGGDSKGQEEILNQIFVYIN